MKESQEIALCSLSETEILLGFGPFTASAKPDESKVSFFISDFFLQDAKPWKIPASSQVLSPTALKAMWKSQLLTALEWKEDSKKVFFQVFEDIQAKIQNGELKKAVPLVFEEAKRRGCEKVLFSFLQQVREMNVSESLYGYSFADDGVIGVSPEILFERKADGSLCTMALAGTKSKEDAALLEDDSKEKAEHEYVIRGIEDSLAPCAKIKRGKTSLLALSHLVHLCTPLEIVSEQCLSFEKLVEALHPTPALGCFPRSFNATWLRAQEKQHKRHAFGAPFGVRLPDGREKCVVAIRNIAWDEQKISIAAGCGVVAQSNAEQEWKELKLKRNAVKKAFGLMV
ncbi:MAG: hypothetical protein COV43_05645 [Deltaproteobacteria bacterium CG11_big_fil_rev_8_21_14_0_20_42_23]|nr:MAG: hypothetical protein COV43_05645 [Deltaproteobacteria bacterium CG11_big_fil_rev_8_21_14_0_20_42_23]PJC64870.1 MAG: hypothetical protein CO021_02010 [Deltaproteobacteria bacterium CG_4_9_14_0_2_um_filter_42_21]